MSIFSDLGIETVDVPESYTRALADTRVQMILASPLFSYLIAKVDEIGFSRFEQTAFAVVHEERTGIYFNDHFFGSLTLEERAFVLYHELSHIYKTHIERMIDLGYRKERWNRATDYQINLDAAGVYLNDNGDVVYNKRYRKYMSLPAGGLYDQKYLGMSSDEIYDLLDDDPENDTNHFVGNGGSKKLIEQQIRDVQAATTYAEMTDHGVGVGDCVGETYVIRRFRELYKPVADWGAMFFAAIDSTVPSRRSYMKYSSLNQPNGGVIFPANHGKKIKIAFAVDTSGSMGDDDYLRAVSELDGIMNSYESWEITLFNCDTQAHKIGTFTSEDGITVREIAEKTIGGGGTYMSPIIEEVERSIEDDDEKINAVVIITDGYISDGDIDNAIRSDIMVIVVVTKAKTLKLKKAVTIHVE